MYFDGWDAYGLQCIGYGDAGMSVRGGVDDNAIEFAICALNFVNNSTLRIGLEETHFQSSFFGSVFDIFDQIRVTLRTIEIGLPQAE